MRLNIFKITIWMNSFNSGKIGKGVQVNHSCIMSYFFGFEGWGVVLVSFTFRDFGRRRRAGERVCAVFAGREKFNDNARVATGEVGPLNQYGGGVPGAPNGGRRRRACAVHIFRGGARRAAPLWRGGRRRTPPPPLPPPSSCLRVSTARKPGDLRERSHRRQRTADHDRAHHRCCYCRCSCCRCRCC